MHMIRRLAGSLSILVAVLGYLPFALAQPADNTPNIGSTGYQPTTIAGLAIYVKTLEPSSATVIDAMKAEIEQLLRPLGMPIDWRQLDRVYVSAPDLAVLTLHGACDAGIQRQRPQDVFRLGWTHVSEGQILPFAELDCDRLRWVIQKDLLRTTVLIRDLRMGRALGRIAAHELYHIFAHTMDHGSEGLTKAAITRDELTMEECRFRPQDLHAMRLGLVNVRRVLSLVHGVADGSPVSGRSLFQENGCSTCHGIRGQGTREGPSLRGKVAGPGATDESIAKELARMYAVSGCKPPEPSLDEREIGDLISYLKAIE